MKNELEKNIEDTAFAFRGYNVTNLGRTPELLAHAVYGPTVRRCLEEAAAVCAKTIGNPVDLVARVEQRKEPSLAEYAESISMIFGAEVAQLELLEEFHDVHFGQAKSAFGYSLGELAAVACSGMFNVDDVLSVPVAMAADSASLADEVTMGVLFSRGPVIEEAAVHRLCRQITADGKGTIAISSVLSPNTYLLLGQHETINRFKTLMHDVLPMPVHLRINGNDWPPLHTPIARQRNIPDRAAVMMETLRDGYHPPRPPILSLVTGKTSYDELTAREILRDWVDHPQRLWDAVYQTLSSGVTTVIHVGPEPNVIPATFNRLSENVQQQTAGSLGIRTAARLAQRPWLSVILPSRTALLRAPSLNHVILEDWLLEHGESLG